jgi:hypothetical protein
LPKLSSAWAIESTDAPSSIESSADSSVGLALAADLQSRPRRREGRIATFEAGGISGGS